MNPFQIHANDIGAFQAEMGADCPVAIVLGTQIQIIPGTAMLNKQLREGGFSQMYDLSFTALVSQFIPAIVPDLGALAAKIPNSTLTYLGLNYKVSNFHLSAGATQVAIEANSVTKMPDAVTLICTVDTSGLNKGIALALQWSKRTPKEAVDTAAYFIAIDAQAGMPFVDIPTIDEELGAIQTPMIGRRGKPIKRKQFKGTKLVTVSRGGQDYEVPLAVLLIQARVTPSLSNGYKISRYNELTNFKYAIGQSPFKGVSRAAGRALMAAAVSKMIARRHSSTHFLQAGWSDAINILFPLSVSRYARGSHRRASGVRVYSSGLGDATPAEEGYLATAIIQNNIGSEGKDAANLSRAIQMYGLPALQEAVDREGVSQINYFLRKSADAELVPQFNAVCN